jgi:hypothetical protein
MKIDFTTTGMCRPEIYARTLTSFKSNLHGINLKTCTLHLNLDPLPPEESLAQEMVKVAQKVFGWVNVNRPEVANFASAVKWCWQQPCSEYFFHLEDDWELVHRVDINDLVNKLDADHNLTCVSLRAYHWPSTDERICLSPGLFRTEHARVMAERLVVNANPEKQLRAVTPENPHGGRHEGFRGTFVPVAVVLQDLGRDWMDSRGWVKTDPAYFVNWERA